LSLLVVIAQAAAQANAEFPAHESPEPLPGLVTDWDLASERYLDGQTVAGIPWLTAYRLATP
jgi:hypothetical protein